MSSLPVLHATHSSTTTKSPNPPLFSTSRRRPKTHHRFTVSCNVPNSDDNLEKQRLILPQPQKLILPTVDRRSMLLGLGGLYSTANLTSLPPSAFAAPIMAPDISTCMDSAEGFQDLKNAVRSRACCPPPSPNPPKAFSFPTDGIKRVRPAAHRATTDYVDMYKAALQAMRDLPDDHPHSFVQQANIHCAYCNGGYTQVASGFPDKELQVHNTWIFFPFHRWYLYFYERILAKLINVPDFALPYWNWDNPTGMTLPTFFEEDGQKNPAFDAYRDGDHLPPTIVDLNYNGADTGASCIEQISTNLATMYRQMVSNASEPLSFFGGEYRAGDDPVQLGDASIGSIDGGCHTAIHRWMGNPRMPNGEDMGNFYSAGYDPAFYLHHSNVDRMWKVWKDLGYPGHCDPTDSDWLDASYVFYDENGDLVRVYNRDCVDISKLNYDYDPSPLPWLNSKPVAKNKKSNIAKKSTGSVKKVQELKFPLKLDQKVKVLVKRPATKRSATDKDKSKEILLIKSIRFVGEKFVKFDVFVNDQDDKGACSAFQSEFAGSFSHLPHFHRGKMLMTSGARFGLTELLEEIEAEEDEYILVTLLPKTGCEEVTIGEIKVGLVPIA